MSQPNEYTQKAIEHIRHLSEAIGGRVSCTPAERRAAEYVADQMRLLGVSDVRLEPYEGAPSTYRPYALAFTSALAGTLLVWLVAGRGIRAVAAVLSGLGGWGMLAETDFATNWMRWLVPRVSSQNAVGVIPPTGQVWYRVLLSAHLDTHRTPILYSTKTWHRWFGFLVAGALVSMAVGAVVYGLGAAFDWPWVRWTGLAATVIEIVALSFCLQADFTPFSPGANDDASGAGVILAMAERLSQEPLVHTGVWLALTGCEEVAAYGMAAFLDAHQAELGDDAVYIVLDQVGLGRLSYLTADGLIVKRKTHPRALELVQQAKAALPELEVDGHVGIAYTDAAVATKRSLIALTVDALPPPGVEDAMHWHQMSDTLDHVDPQVLAEAYASTWRILQQSDQGH
jgi:hypothetical protein